MAESRQSGSEQAVRLRDALAEIIAVLGTGKCEVPNCEGCEWERYEAVRIAKEAVGLDV